jgi:hypothetical protein
VIWDSNGDGRLARARQKLEALHDQEARTPATTRNLQVADVLLSRQRHLRDEVEKVMKNSVREVWYGGEGNDSEVGHCLPLAVDWLLNLCRGRFGQLSVERLAEVGFVKLER